MFDENAQHLQNGKSPSKTILLVEDDRVIAELLVQMITQETYYHAQCKCTDKGDQSTSN